MSCGRSASSRAEPGSRSSRPPPSPADPATLTACVISSGVFIRELALALHHAGVAYAVVGGVAVNLHGVPRMTYDIDLVVATDEENLRRCREALESVGLVCRLPLRLEALADESVRREHEEQRSLRALTFTDPSDPLREVDVVVAPSRDPDGVVSRAVEVPAGGFSVRVAAVGDIIAMKRLAGRAQDRADIEHLLRLKKRDG